MRNLKAAGLALVAMLALGVFASAAQAEGEGTITTVGDVYPVTLHAESNASEKFTAFGSEVTCGKSTFTATLTEASHEVTITPKYEECHVPGPFGITLPATVTMNSCDFRLYHATTDPDEPKSDFWVLTTQIECKTAGDVIEVHVYANHTKHTEGISICTDTIPPQTNKNGPTAENTTTPAGDGTIDLSGSIINLVATAHNSSSLCPEGSGEFETESAEQDLAEGGVKVEAEAEEEHVSVHIG